MTNPPTAVAGLGNMAKALMSDLFKQSDRVVIIQNSTAKRSLEVVNELRTQFPKGAKFLTSAEASQSDSMRMADVGVRNIIGVKPDQFRKMSAEDFPASFRQSKSTLVSLMAGVPISEIQLKFEEAEQGVRTMPNTPAEEGQGVTAFMTFGDVDALTHGIVKDMGATSLVVELTDEDQFHGSTAVSGSGPAFSYHLVKTFESYIAESTKMPESDARKAAIDGLRRLVADELDKSPLSKEHDEKIRSYLPAQLPALSLAPEHKQALEQALQAYVSGVMQGAKAAGLDESIALPSLYGTLLGSTTRYEKKTAVPFKFDDLCDEIAGKKKPGVKGGTTRAGLNVLDEAQKESIGKLWLTEPLMMRVTQAAAERSQELALPTS